MLLLGLALENAIKAVHVAFDKTGMVQRVGINSESWRSDGGHDLPDLATKVMELSDEDAELLRRLQEHIIWAGRYPVPKKSSRYFGSLRPKNLRVFNSSDFAVAEELMKRLRQLLENAGFFQCNCLTGACSRPLATLVAADSPIR